MIGRHLGEKPHHQRADGLGDDAQHAAFLGDLHQPEEKRHHPDQPDGQCHRAGGGLDHAGGERLHGRDRLRRGRRPCDLAITRDQERDQHDGEKDAVHGVAPGLSADPRPVTARAGRQAAKHSPMITKTAEARPESISQPAINGMIAAPVSSPE